MLLYQDIKAMLNLSTFNNYKYASYHQQFSRQSPELRYASHRIFVTKFKYKV